MRQMISNRVARTNMKKGRTQLHLVQISWCISRYESHACTKTMQYDETGPHSVAQDMTLESGPLRLVRRSHVESIPTPAPDDPAKYEVLQGRATALLICLVSLR